MQRKGCEDLSLRNNSKKTTDELDSLLSTLHHKERLFRQDIIQENVGSSIGEFNPNKMCHQMKNENDFQKVRKDLKKKKIRRLYKHSIKIDVQHQKAIRKMILFPIQALFYLNSYTPLHTLDLTCWVTHLIQLRQELQQSFSIQNCHITSEMFENVSSDKGFSSIVFEHCPLLNDDHVLLVVKLFGLVVRNIRVKNCPLITDKACQYLSKNVLSMECLFIDNCKNITDLGLRYIACCRSLSSSLKKLSLSSCNQVTDNGISFLVKKSPHLIYLDLSYTNISDGALISISDSLSHQLHNINFSGCTRITDMGITEFLKSCTSLRKISLSNCSNITDASLQAIYQKKTLYGYRAHGNHRSLQSIELNENENITFKTLIWISKACPNLRILKLRNGTQIKNLNEAFVKLGSLSYLECLDLYGCSHVSDTAVQSFINSTKSESFVTLNLSKIGSLSHSTISTLCSKFLCLTDLELGNVSTVTDAAFQEICLNLRQLKSLVISSQNEIQDSSLQLLSNSCHHLQSLDISHNSQFGFDAFLYFNSFNFLVKLDISYCANVDYTVIDYLPQSIIEFKMNGLTKFTDNGINVFCLRCTGLNSLSIRNCCLSHKGVTNVLIACPNLEYLDFTGTIDDDSLDIILPEINRFNFIASRGAKFKGVAISSEGRDKRKVNESFRLQYLLHDSAIKLQRAYKKFQKRLENLARMKADYQHRRVKALKLLKKHLRFYIPQLRKKLIMKARVMACIIIQKKYRYRMNRKLEMKLFYLCLDYWKQIVISRRNKTIQSVSFRKKGLQKLFFLALNRIKSGENGNEYLTRVADSHYKQKILRKLMHEWNTTMRYVKQYRIQIRQKNALKFMILSNVTFFNSSRFQCVLSSFGKKTKTKVWRCICNFTTYSKSSKSMNAKADEFVTRKLKRRNLPIIFEALQYNKKKNDESRIAQERAISYHKYRNDRKIKKVLSNVQQYVTSLKFQRKNLIIAQQYYITRIKTQRTKFLLENLFSLQLSRVHKYQILTKATDYFKRKSYRKVLHNFVLFLERKRYNTKLCNIAITHNNKVLLRKIWWKWNNVLWHCLLFSQACYAIYKNNLVICYFTKWKYFRIKRIEERNEIAEKEHRVICASIHIQKVYRGWRARYEIKAWIVFRDWAVIVCQTQARVFLAKIMLVKARRLFRVRECLCQEREENQMHQEDLQMQSYRKASAAATELQRVYRGGVGRHKTRTILMEKCHQSGVDFYLIQKQNDLISAQIARQNRILLEKQQNDAACTIQQHFKAYLARIRFIEYKAATKIQSIYRSRQGRRKVASLP